MDIPKISGRSTKFVLIVDDEPLLSMNAADYFIDAGFEVAEAATAEEALKILENQEISILFTDIQMPGIDGVGLATIVALKWPDVRLILTSGVARPSTMALPEKVTFFAKPYDLRAIALVAA